jgi:putative peptidoglycan lipid II flippase
MVGLAPLFEGPDKLYAYAIGVLVATAVQLAMTFPVLRRIGYPVFRFSLPKRGDERVRQVLVLMLPVSVGLGLINIDLVLNTQIGWLISDQAPRAIDAAFRIYMLPQGMFSVAVATVLFPQLSRLAARHDLPGVKALLGVGMRQVALLLIPAAAGTIVLATPIVQLVYQRGEFDAESTKLTAEALFWFAFSLPFSGWNLLLTRTFFSLQKPWLPTILASGSLVVNAAISLALYKPLGIAGVVLGTVISNAVLTVLEAYWLREELGGLELTRSIRAYAGMLAGAVALGAVAYGAWRALDYILGGSLLAQIIEVGGGLTLGAMVYAVVVLSLRIPEAGQILELFASRFARRS